MRCRIRLVLGLIALAIGVHAQDALAIAGNTPTVVNYQGILKNGSGTPLAGTFNVTFAIYDVPSGVNPALWTETQMITTSASGLFNVLLGSTNPLFSPTFSGAGRWLGITIAPDPEMTPRIQLASVPYAYRIATVDGATGGTILGKVSIGIGNTNTGAEAFVTGSANTVAGNFSTVSGGQYNTAYGNFATVGGGGGTAPADSNAASGTFATVGGGRANLSAGNWTTVAGGFDNQTANVQGAFIGGGTGNRNSGGDAVVCGGQQNTNNGAASFVGSGIFNSTGSAYAVITGGDNNTANGQRSTVGGGGHNMASGSYSVVAGGVSDTAAGFASTVPGGDLNVATGSYSLAAGRRAKAPHLGAFVWADSSIDADFSSTQPNQFLIRAAGGVGIGTNSPFTALTLEGTASLGFKNGTAPMMYIYENGTFNPERPIISHSPAFPNWGLKYNDLTDRMIFQSGGVGVMTVDLALGRVGIGNTTPIEALDVAGNIKATGTITAGLACGSGILCLSDARLKTNVANVTGGLGLITRLRGVRYDWDRKNFPDRNFSDARQIGFIAQEIKDVLPELVTRMPDGYYAVDYGRLAPVLVEAIKEQQGTIKDLRTEVEQLKAMVQKLAAADQHAAATVAAER